MWPRFANVSGAKEACSDIPVYCAYEHRDREWNSRCVVSVSGTGEEHSSVIMDRHSSHSRSIVLPGTHRHVT